MSQTSIRLKRRAESGHGEEGLPVVRGTDEKEAGHGQDERIPATSPLCNCYKRWENP